MLQSPAQFNLSWRFLMTLRNLFDNRFVKERTIPQWRPGFHLDIMLLAEIDDGWLMNLGIELDLINGGRDLGMVQ